MDLRKNCEFLIGYWRLGCIPAEALVDWADRVLTAADTGTDVPYWVIALSLKGPAEFLNGDDDERVDELALSFIDAFDAMIEAFDPDREEDVDLFMRWIARACIGEDLGPYPVQVGYGVDSCLDYGDLSGARELTEETMRRYRGTNYPIRDSLAFIGH